MKAVTKRIIILLSALSLSVPVVAQDPDWAEWTDSLSSSLKVESRKAMRGIDVLEVGMKEIRAVVSPLGEGDAISWAQSLPGVTTGADGSSAIYVRGGNMGNNLITLDGVPVYGYSHLLGLTTVVSSGMSESAELVKGGFGGLSGNFTSARLDIRTKTPSRQLRATESVNNFMGEVMLEGPVGKHVSFLVDGRISPLTYEYRALGGLLDGGLSGLEGFGADVHDVFAKVYFPAGKRSRMDATLLSSEDGYGYSPGPNVRQSLGWGNRIMSVRYHAYGLRSTLDLGLSSNVYGTRQNILTEREDGFTEKMELRSSINETSLSRTTREGFADVNGGRPFNAKFDRRHVLNGSAQWRGWSVAMTLQSGHWENGDPARLLLYPPGGVFEGDYYESVNDYRMPAVMRVDVGYALTFRTGPVSHELNLGVFNLTNHFNPFMLYYDGRAGKWMMMSLLPILPNFSYKVKF